MFNKRSLPVLLVIAIAGILIAFTSNGLDNPPSKYEKIFQQVAEMLKIITAPRRSTINSRINFSKFLGNIDPDKNIFLQSDIKELKKYENTQMMNMALPSSSSLPQILSTRSASMKHPITIKIITPFSYVTLNL
jgi:hypothetical protein